MRWAEVSVEATCGSADAVTEILMEEGCGGTAVSCSSASALEDTAEIRGYLPVDDSLEARLERIRERVRSLPDHGLTIGSGDISVKWVQDDEWATAWRKYFKPIRFSRIVVKPSWEDYEPRPDDVIVEIDPGMAFGTGNHDTTALCLLILQDLVRGGETVLDVGTGSGILAIAAAKLGASNVVGVDNDPVAVDAARKNVAMNGVDACVRIARGDTPRVFEGAADVVLANIIPNVIIPMAGALYEKVKPGGRLVTSGIVHERADEVRQALEAVGLETLEARSRGEWVALVSGKRE